MGFLCAGHHTFIQALMRKGFLLEEDALDMVRKLIHRSGLVTSFQVFLQTINEELNSVQIEIRSAVCQDDGKLYFGIVNKSADEYAKFGTRFSPAQIAFFKAIVEAIALESVGEGYLSSIQALNLRPDSEAQGDADGAGSSSQALGFRQLTVSQKDQTLDELVKEGWLSQDDEKRLSLGVRTYAELRQFLAALEIPSCEICQEVTVKGEVCGNVECDARMHRYCVARKFSRAGVPRTCPKCSENWPGAEPNGKNIGNDRGRDPENGQNGEQRGLQSSQRIHKSRPQRDGIAGLVHERQRMRDERRGEVPNGRRGRAVMSLEEAKDSEEEDEDDDDDDDDDDEEEHPPLLTSQCRSLRHSTAANPRTQQTVVEDSESDGPARQSSRPTRTRTPRRLVRKRDR